ncbi:hypothetical protein LTR36_001696 [Oleoguttula mirabilis]|uniref:Alcohol dehydrogenase n=1 Tax=Oleoguttula mirabilis TaxID=1507867 RepID=A0AAV9JNL9_9PEZI|nr:hypothetical protein LTR36_001696 [Oleoguttula mirabilis]
MAPDLPPQYRALVLDSIGAGFTVKTLPTPQPTFGSAVVQIVAAGALSYHREIYNGQRHYPLPTPMVGGYSAIGRIAALGPDATALQAGQLVFVDCVIRGRDDPSALYLLGISEGHSDGSKKLAREVWHDGTLAEFVKVPLDNCIPLDEARLCQTLGYSIEDLMYMGYLLVPYGGLRDIRVEPGDTVVVCPATGGFGGAGVLVAVAMGARVIAMGRNEQELERLQEHVHKGTPWACVETVKITGDEAIDTASLKAYGPVDAILDFTPPVAAKSTHLKSAVAALRYEGRVSLMGFVDFSVSDMKIVGSNITLKGKLMYSREDMLQFVKMLEMGLLPKGKDLVDTRTFRLDEWEEAFDAAAQWTGVGRAVAFLP